MLHQQGKVTITGESVVVVGQGAGFVTAGVPTGAFLTLHEMVGSVQIARVVDNSTLLLVRPFPGIPAGMTLTFESYAISSEFTAMLMMPYPNRGDIDNAALLTRAFDILDEAVPTP